MALAAETTAMRKQRAQMTEGTWASRSSTVTAAAGDVGALLRRRDRGLMIFDMRPPCSRAACMHRHNGDVLGLLSWFGAYVSHAAFDCARLHCRSGTACTAWVRHNR